MWYTQEEKPLRFGLWTVTNGAMPVPFLVIYYGLGHVTTGPVVRITILETVSPYGKPTNIFCVSASNRGISFSCSLDYSAVLPESFLYDMSIHIFGEINGTLTWRVVVLPA